MTEGGVMFGSDWLAIAISVVFVWFLLALSVSAMNEAIVRILALRSKQLWKALAQLIDGTESPTGLVSNLTSLPTWPKRPADPGATTSVTAELYGTATVQALESRTSPTQKTRINNIPVPIFSQALLELMSSTPGATPMDKIKGYITTLGDIPLKPQLQALFISSNNDVAQFRAAVDRWFDSQMSRLSAIYRLQLRLVLLGLGLVVAIVAFTFGLRSDALGLVGDLQHDANLRTFVVGSATDTANASLAKAGDCGISLNVDPAACQLKGAENLKEIDLSFQDDGPPFDASVWDRLSYLAPWHHVRALVGVLLTGIAISFGATFWFTILQRLVGLRSGGKAAPS